MDADGNEKVPSEALVLGTVSTNWWLRGVPHEAEDVAQTMIDTAYGYHNFERFRKRVLLILTYSKAI